MTPDQIAAMIDERVAAAVASHNQEISEAIAFGLRTYADRPVGEKGSPSLQFGVVEQVEDTYAYVTLDGQTDAVPINMLGGLVVGERVAVLLVPPSGNLAIGMVSPAVVGSLPPGGTATQVLTKIDATDGNADWENASAGGGFPVGPEDDGTATHEISVASGVLTARSENDADSTKKASLLLAGAASAQEAVLTATDGSTGAGLAAAVISGLAQVQINVDGTTVAQVTSNEFHFNGPDPMQMFIGGAGGCAIGVYLGDPNGVVGANQGSLILDLTGAAPWYNTDGATAWTQLT